MSLVRLAFLSLLNRRGTAFLTVFCIALSVALLLGVEKVRNGARASFASTISGTDLIVGSRAGDVQLLLYSVFRIGDATNNITWESYQDIANRPEVKWIVPMSLGDSHRGYRVVGTTPDFFVHYQYRKNLPLSFASGAAFDDLFDAVIGADVAEALGYEVGSSIVVAHGTSSTGSDHDNRPFRVSGILERTGTPVDKAVHVSLQAIEAIHVDWRSGTRVEALDIPEERIRAMDLQPKAITAALVGLNSRIQAFRFQRYINDYDEEPLTAILPGVALTRLWSLIGIAERALSAVSLMVVFTALIGLISTLLASLQERRREMAILRANGARPLHIAGLLITESGLLTLAGALLGFALVYVGLIGQPLGSTTASGSR
jgi:putative ABC transport system permease protein